ncbi:hypothetical protein B7P43_G01301 [Cryptotermes secundus]|uniref:DUF659 domain-containing protein n=1 Tax=Cryptotermes secundus TaxID=105785 RepID=A0A2J7REF6_9NEOP|nr:hypothetical protein B7P43_G01301 [Cryptotermes secundus]
MPKVSTCSSRSARLRSFVQEFGDKVFSTDGKIFYCKLCGVKVTAEKRFTVQQHCKTFKHGKCLSRLSTKDSRQSLLFKNSSTNSSSSSSSSSSSPSPSSTNNGSEFSKDLCQWMVSSNIPLEKLHNQHFRQFLETYTSHPIPSESTLRKNYLSTCYEDMLNKIRTSVADNKIWVSLDETSDVDGRYIANVIVGTLKQDQPGERFLLDCEVLERANHSTIAVLFDNSMKLLWPNGIQRNNVLLLVTDAAPYMKKAAKGLRILYPKMVHITCLAHALHRVAEEVRGHFPDVDRLVSNGKKIFIKAPLRVQKFKQEAPLLPLPPQPVVTRWGTWLDAVAYYCENYTAIEKMFNGFDSSESTSIKAVKDLFSTTLAQNLAYIKSNFCSISGAITRLEFVGTELCDALDTVKSIENELNRTRGEISDRIKTKIESVLHRNAGYSTLCKIADILSGKLATFEDDTELSPNDLTFFKYAPVTSCDVERSFSKYKTILSDNRRSFKFENLKMHVVINCNCNSEN